MSVKFQAAYASIGYVTTLGLPDDLNYNSNPNLGAYVQSLNNTIVPQPTMVGNAMLPPPSPSKRVLIAGIVFSVATNQLGPPAAIGNDPTKRYTYD